jgi:GTP cyclohydrolase II
MSSAGEGLAAPGPGKPEPVTPAPATPMPATPMPATRDLEDAGQRCLREPSHPRPVVTLSWAQSARGAIARSDGAPEPISGPESMAMTPRLRAMHDAILVGILTVLSDDPLLSVRLAEGPQPQPIVLDSRLRFPLTARMLARTDRKPWIFHAGRSRGAAEALEKKGAVLFSVAPGPGGLDLREVLGRLRGAGITSLMVEGGAQVLRAFITQGLAAQAVVTVSPKNLEGIPGPGVPTLASSLTALCGEDRVTWGRLVET